MVKHDAHFVLLKQVEEILADIQRVQLAVALDARTVCPSRSTQGCPSVVSNWRVSPPVAWMFGQSCVGFSPAPNIPPTQRLGSTITTDL
jgi:hypothetical protein